MAGAGGKHADEARQIADMEIPKVLNDIDARNRRDQQEKLWSQLVGEYKTVLEANNRTAMQSVKDRLSPFQNGPHAPEAQQYVKRLEELMKAEPPQPRPPAKVDPNPPTQPPADSSGASDEANIRQLFDSLSKVFDSRSASDLQNLWPQVDKSTLEAYRKSFQDKGLKSVARKYAVSSVSVTGDSAKATGVWTGVHFSNGRLLMNDQVKWSANLRKMGGRWVITKLE